MTEESISSICRGEQVTRGQQEPKPSQHITYTDWGNGCEEGDACKNTWGGSGRRAARQGAEALGWQEEDIAIRCECLITETPACCPHEEVAVRCVNVIYNYWYDYPGKRKVTLFSGSSFTGQVVKMYFVAPIYMSIFPLLSGLPCAEAFTTSSFFLLENLPCQQCH